MPFWQRGKTHTVSRFLVRCIDNFLRTSHHHVHTTLGAAVCGDVGLRVASGLWPARGRYLVDGCIGVLRSGESGSPACQEQEARVMGFEEQRHEGGGHDLRACDVDVPGGVPGLAHRHAAGLELRVEPGAWIMN